MRSEARSQALHRAAKVVGGRHRLREMLGVSMLELDAWMNGAPPPPTDVFLRAVDIISSGQLLANGEAVRGLWATVTATMRRAQETRAAIVASRLAMREPAQPRSALAFLGTRFAPAQGASMIEAALGAAVAATSADMGTLQIVHPEGLLLVAQRNFEKPFLDYFALVQKEGSCAVAADKAERVIVPDVQKSAIFAGTPSAQVMHDARAHAVQSTPLVSPGGKLVGMISTHYDRPHEASPRELDIVDHIARRAAFWLDGGVL